MDSVDPIRRSAIMRSVRQKNTGPEMALRQALHALGLRYRLHAKELPGRPDSSSPGEGHASSSTDASGTGTGVERRRHPIPTPAWRGTPRRSIR